MTASIGECNDVCLAESDTLVTRRFFLSEELKKNMIGFSQKSLDIWVCIRYNQITKNGEKFHENETVVCLWKLKEIFIYKSLSTERRTV